MKRTFRKSDLEIGMVVETMVGNRYLYFERYFSREGGFLNITDYDNNLEHCMFNKFTIKKVYRVCQPIILDDVFDDYLLTLIWEREDDEIRENDIIKIINAGSTYTSYSDWITNHIEQPYRYFWDCGQIPDTSHKFKVLIKGVHDLFKTPLYYIEDCNTRRCYLIKADGIAKIE